MRKLSTLYCFTIFTAFSFLTSTLGCTPQEKEEAQVLLQQALANLTANRTLTEQFVRDVKANSNISDPAYLQALESYQNARETYNRFLDEAESGDKVPHTRSLRGRTAVDVQNATADFLADATAILKPNISTRHVQFQRAVVIPDGLSAHIRHLPKKARELLLDEFDEQVRWRPWSDL